MNTKLLVRAGLVLFTFLTPALTFAYVVGGTQTNAGGSYSFLFTDGVGTGGPGLCTGTICGVASTILYLINSVLVPLLFAIAFLVFLYGIAKTYIFSAGDAEKIKEGHQLVLWGIIGFVVMISLWGLVNVVANTFGLGGPGLIHTKTY